MLAHYRRVLNLFSAVLTGTRSGARFLFVDLMQPF